VVYNMEKTTIQVDKNTLERLKTFKQHNKDSYDFVLNNILDDAEENVLSEKEMEEIKFVLEEVKKGKVYSIEAVAKELGIKLG